MTDVSKGWQPIETAPDNDLILVCGEHGEHGDDWWFNVAWLVDGEDCDLRTAPTHWMPLPAPPETTHD